eukprot:5570387-Amphidinium_carterae.1
MNAPPFWPQFERRVELSSLQLTTWAHGCTRTGGWSSAGPPRIVEQAYKFYAPPSTVRRIPRIFGPQLHRMVAKREMYTSGIVELSNA